MAWVKPAPDRVYRIPATKQLLEAEGREVDTAELDWARALRDGDVVISDPPAPPAPPAKGAAKASQPAPAAEGEG